MPFNIHKLHDEVPLVAPECHDFFKPSMTELTAKRQRFVAEYLLDCNATQAAIRAEYSAKNADKIGSQLLGKSRVKMTVDHAQQERAKL